MAELTDRELELVRKTAHEVMQSAGHICHYPEDERKGLHELADPEKGRIPKLVEMADAASVVGIDARGHILIFSLGKGGIVVGQNTLQNAIKYLFIFICVAVAALFLWKPVIAPLFMKLMEK